MGRLLLLFKYSKYGTPSILGLLSTQKRFPSFEGMKAFLLVSPLPAIYFRTCSCKTGIHRVRIEYNMHDISRASYTEEKG